jgi:hypothetical protein
MSRQREIARPDWPGFLERFTGRHEGWLVTVEHVSMPADAAAVAARDLPLEQVTADPGGAISISVGSTPGRHLTVTVDRAERLLLEQTDEGTETALRIERRDGPATRVRFRSAVRPEEVDGLPPPH